MSNGLPLSHGSHDVSTHTKDGSRRGATGGHAMLDVFAGTWGAHSLFWVQPGAAPIRSTGTMRSKWILGQRYLEQSYTSAQIFDEEYAGRGLWGFNTTVGAYECVWCDTAACMILFERGGFDKEKNIYIADSTFVSPVTGQIMRRRTVVTIRSEDEHILETFIGPEPGVTSDADRDALVSGARELVSSVPTDENPFDSSFSAPKVMEIRFSRL